VRQESCPSVLDSRRVRARQVRFAAALTESSAPERFDLYWIVSENKAFCGHTELLQACIQMKALNQRLHAQYMRLLEA
jgi:hypothetical protein